MLIDQDFNLTQFTGLLAFGFASLSAFRASSVMRKVSVKVASQWRWIGIFQLLYALEVLWGTRHAARELVNMALRSIGLHQGRASIQELLLVGVGVCSVAFAIALWRSMSFSVSRDGSGKIAIVCTALGFLLFLIETISLHSIDQLLYQPVGPVLLIAYAWLGIGVGVTLSARQDMRAGPAKRAAGA